MKFVVIAGLLLLIGCISLKKQYSEPELDRQRNKTEFTTDFISKEKFVTLLNHNNIDSLYDYLKNTHFFHPSIYAIIDESDQGYSVPSFTFNITDTQRVTIILLDTLNNFMELLMNGEFEAGPYTIYSRTSVIDDSIAASIEEVAIFKHLEILGNEYVYKKVLFIK